MLLIMASSFVCVTIVEKSSKTLSKIQVNSRLLTWILLLVQVSYKGWHDCTRCCSSGNEYSQVAHRSHDTFNIWYRVTRKIFIEKTLTVSSYCTVLYPAGPFYFLKSLKTSSKLQGGMAFMISLLFGTLT